MRELLLMVRRRAQHLNALIKPDLSLAGRVLISDVLPMRTYAYQGGGRAIAH